VIRLFKPSLSVLNRGYPCQLGRRLPLGVGAASMALLASLDDEEIAQIIAVQREKSSIFPCMKAEKERVLINIERTRRKGYAVSLGAVTPGVSGVGVLVPTPPGVKPLAIGLSGIPESESGQRASRLAAIISAAIQTHLDEIAPPPAPSLMFA
jgi:DNA-binding IclR family transcriptional regulator